VLVLFVQIFKQFTYAGGGQHVARGVLSHFIRLQLRSCSKIFESGSGNFSNLRIRPLFRLRNLPMFYLRNDRTDSCYCRNGKMTPDPDQVSHKFLTPVLDTGPKEKRRILPESTPALRIRYHLCIDRRVSVVRSCLILHWIYKIGKRYIFRWIFQKVHNNEKRCIL